MIQPGSQQTFEPEKKSSPIFQLAVHVDAFDASVGLYNDKMKETMMKVAAFLLQTTTEVIFICFALHH